MKTVSCLALLFFLIACGKKKECPEESLIPAYIGYTDDQLDTLVIRRYDPGNSFSHLVDSTRFTLTNTTRLRIGDTVLVHIPDGIYHFNGQYDWQFNNPFDSV